MTPSGSLDHARLHVASADLYHQALEYVSALDSASAALEITSAVGGLSDPEEAEVTSSDVSPPQVSSAIASVAHAAASVGATAALAHGGASAASFASTPGGEGWLRDLVREAEGEGDATIEGASPPRDGEAAGGPLEALWAAQRRVLVAARAQDAAEGVAADAGAAAADEAAVPSPGLSPTLAAQLPAIAQAALAVSAALVADAKAAEKVDGAAAKGADAASPSGLSLAALVPPTPFPTSLVAPAPLIRDARVSALLLAGESLLALRDLERAETALSDAVTAAEGVSGADALLAAPLLALGHLYARTGRVTLAEGLYREASKRLGLKGAETGHVRWTASRPGAAAAAASAAAAPVAPVHTLTAALVAWRNAQLMAALPRRAKETAAWKEVAADLFAKGTPWRGAETASPDAAYETLESRWGALRTLRGEGTWGAPAIVDMRTRRVFV